jgi:hypothetical protein
VETSSFGVTLESYASSTTPLRPFKKYQILPTDCFPDEVMNEEEPVTFAAIARQDYTDRRGDRAEKDQFVYTLALVPTG